MKERTVLMAHEVEERLDAMRKAKDIDEKFEKRFVENAVKQARNNGKTGDVTTFPVDPVYLHVPCWQRPCEIARAKAIGENYNVDSWDEPKVLYWDGKLWLIDGMHRGFGTALAGKDEIVVRLMSESATMKSAINIFLNQTDLIKKMSLTDKMEAALQAEVPEYITLKRLCDKNRICLNGTLFNEGEHVGTFTSLRDGLSMAKSNPELLDRIFSLTTRLQWNGNTMTIGKAYGARAFRTLKKLYAYYGNNKEELERTLLENCSGATFWNDNLEKKTQAQMFDYMSDCITKHINLTDFAEKTISNTAKVSGKKLKMA